METSSDSLLEDYLKIKMDLELIPRPHIQNFFFLWYYINWPNFITRLCLFPKLLKCVSCFKLGNLIRSWYLNIWKVKVWLSQEQKELSKWNKKHSSLFHKCSPLDFENWLVSTYKTGLIELRFLDERQNFTFTNLAQSIKKDLKQVLKQLWGNPAECLYPRLIECCFPHYSTVV